MRVVGIGDQVADQYEHIHVMYPGGNALNFAVFARKLGYESAFLGAFGNDAAAAHVRESAGRMEIDLSHCRYYEGENGFARVTLKDGDRVFLGSNRCGVLREKGLRLTEADYRYLQAFDLIHSGLYGFAERELKELSGRGCRISYDFSGDYDEEQLRETLPIVNYAFFSASHLSQEEREELAGRAIRAGCELALCTCGSRGAFLYDGESEYRQPPHLVKAEDTMAAGDAFITGFILYYLSAGREGRPDRKAVIREALEQASLFAAKQCMLPGSFGCGKEY